LAASLDVMQIDPTISYQVTDQLSIGAAPTLTLANLIASPLFLAPLSPVDHTYREGVGTRYTWGAGFQVGAYYTTDACWNFGASYKSTQWMEPLRFRTHTPTGAPEDTEFRFDYPPIISVGTSYTGWDNWVFACDVRYFAYSSTQGFGRNGFAPDGSVTGLAWKDIYSVASGVQRQITEKFCVRMGYVYNDNPITSEAAQFNVASPLIIQHAVHMGCSYMFADSWMFNLAYAHAFENSITGPIQQPGIGAIPGSSLTSTISADLLTAGFTKRF
jgi:long-chain fatty acid transport protein